jgi:hypothetical protein
MWDRQNSEWESIGVVGWGNGWMAQVGPSCPSCLPLRPSHPLDVSNVWIISERQAITSWTVLSTINPRQSILVICHDTLGEEMWVELPVEIKAKKLEEKLEWAGCSNTNTEKPAVKPLGSVSSIIGSLSMDQVINNIRGQQQQRVVARLPRRAGCVRWMMP